MRKVLFSVAFVTLSFITVLLLSCSQGEYVKYHWDSTVYNGPFGTGGNNKICCATVTCSTAPVHNCQRHVDDAGASCGDFEICPIVNKMDTLAKYYNGDSMSAYYSKYDLNALVPELAIYRADAYDSLIAGSYKLHVSAADSSIIILAAPFDSITSKNVVWAAEGVNRVNFPDAAGPRN